jgi:hypothetical protein
MKPGQYFALITGTLFVAIGIAGFFPELVSPAAVDPDTAGLGTLNGYGDLFGLFPINVLHNLVHLTVGVLGLLASITLSSSRLYAGVLALFYGALAVMGLLPPTQASLGFIPIFGNDVWLHAVTAAIAAYFGFIATPDLLEMAEDKNPNQTTSAQ